MILPKKTWIEANKNRMNANTLFVKTRAEIIRVIYTWRSFYLNKDGLIFLTGSCAYPTLEMIWRGKTHYSMAIAGGVCLLLINKICCGRMSMKSLFSKCLAGAGIITGVELFTGLVVNNLLRFDVWDYSKMPMNILGQVCLPYSVLWFGLSLPAMALCEICKKSHLLES